MSNIVLKILGILTLILIVFYVYYKLKYKFWSRQPVFHIHNLKYWIFPPGFIQKEMPKKEKPNKKETPEKIIHQRFMSFLPIYNKIRELDILFKKIP